MWILFAFGSALFAGLTAILAKIGIRNTDTDVASALRTVVVLVFSWFMAWLVGSIPGIGAVSGRTWLFLVLSGFATGASWLCYFRALQMGDVNKVTPIDKSSTVLTMLLAFLFLGEPLTWVKALAMALIGGGAYLMIQRKRADKASTDATQSSAATTQTPAGAVATQPAAKHVAENAVAAGTAMPTDATLVSANVAQAPTATTTAQPAAKHVAENTVAAGATMPIQAATVSAHVSSVPTAMSPGAAIAQAPTATTAAQPAAKPKNPAWLLYAVGSAVFASLTSILGKIGIENVNSTLGTAIRTGVVLVMAWAIVFARGKQSAVRRIDRRSVLFLVLSGIATGASWLCYYHALQTGPASVVVPIDKLSILVSIAFSRVVFGERLTLKAGFGLLMIVAGTLALLL